MDTEPDPGQLKKECNRLIDRITRLQDGGRLLDEEISRLEQRKAEILSGTRPCPEEKTEDGTGGNLCKAAGKEPEGIPYKETGKEPEGNFSRGDEKEPEGKTCNEVRKDTKKVSGKGLPAKEESLLKEQIGHKSSGKDIVVVYGQTRAAETLGNILKVVLLVAVILLLTAAATAALYFMEDPSGLPGALRAVLKSGGG